MTKQYSEFTFPMPPPDFFDGREELSSRLAHAVRRGQEMTVDTKAVAFILSDIEGCLNYDPLTYDHEFIAYLRDINKSASWSNALPFITLCTGRQAPFVDAFSAFLAVRLPVIFEGGCGLFFPTRPPGDRHIWHPLISDAHSGSYKKLEEVVINTASETGARASLGKGRLLTFHPHASGDVDGLLEAFRRALSDQGVDAEITRSANAVDISLAGITKGTAVDWLLDTIAERGGPQLTVDHVVGIGDAPNDLSFLRVAGMSVAPANADPAIIQAVDVRAQYTDAKAVAETVILAINRNIEAAS